MTTKQGIGLMLYYLHELYPSRPPITEATGDAWLTTFADADDAVMLAAAKQCGREPERKFFPTPGEIFAYFPKDETPDISAHEVLRQIELLGAYDNGWHWPRIERVRDVLGSAVAEAYGDVGSPRLNSESPTTREIAERDFAVALKGARADERRRGTLPGPRPVPLLEPGQGRGLTSGG